MEKIKDKYYAILDRYDDVAAHRRRAPEHAKAIAEYGLGNALAHGPVVFNNVLIAIQNRVVFVLYLFHVGFLLA